MTQATPSIKGIQEFTGHCCGITSSFTIMQHSNDVIGRRVRRQGQRKGMQSINQPLIGQRNVTFKNARSHGEKSKMDLPPALMSSRGSEGPTCCPAARSIQSRWYTWHATLTKSIKHVTLFHFLSKVVWLKPSPEACFQTLKCLKQDLESNVLAINCANSSA